LIDTNFLCVCLHPGIVRTDMVQDYIDKLKRSLILLPIFFLYPFWMAISKSSRQGAETTIYLATEDYDRVKEFNGSYFWYKTFRNAPYLVLGTAYFIFVLFFKTDKKFKTK
jgi:hypothetical protein